MKISICLATYNGEKYIAEQLLSILEAMEESDELIISDDSSVDKTLAIISTFQDPRIKILPGNSFHDPIYNFENALQWTAGEVVVLSDQDDIWLKNKLEIIRQCFKNKPSRIYVLVLDGLIINESGLVIEDSLFKKLSSGKGLFKNIIHNTYMGCCLAFSRELIEIAVPFPRKIPMHDSWLGLLGELCGVVEFLPEKTIKYRVHPLNQSLKKTQLLQKLKWRYFLLFNLLKRKLSYTLRQPKAKI
jgi:glycosyltransferase involved in cell wall biosynthesis